MPLHYKNHWYSDWELQSKLIKEDFEKLLRLSTKVEHSLLNDATRQIQIDKIMEKIIGKEETKAEKRKRRREEKKAKEQAQISLPPNLFLDSAGNNHNLKDIVTKEECWPKVSIRRADKKKITKWILTDSAIQKLVKTAGLLKSEVSDPIFQPSPENRHEYAVWVTVSCKSRLNEKEECLHGFKNNLTSMLGEANDDNLTIGKGYPLIMAEKRGFHRAVIAHLRLDNVYSEEEAEEFVKEEPTVKLSSSDFDKIKDIVNGIINAKTLSELNEIAKGVNERKEDLTESQLLYLRELYFQNKKKFDQAF